MTLEDILDQQHAKLSTITHLICHAQDPDADFMLSVDATNGLVFLLMDMRDSLAEAIKGLPNALLVTELTGGAK